MLGANLHFGSCPEDKILNMLQATIQKLRELLHSERNSSAEAPISEFMKASGHPFRHEDSARTLRKVLHLFKEWSVLHTHRVDCLRDALNTTVQALMERDKHANHGHAVLGASREGNFHKHVYISNLIQSVLGDMHSIAKTLFLTTNKFDSAITIISEVNLQNAEAVMTRDDPMICDLKVYLKDRLVLPQIFSKEQCDLQDTEPEHSLNLSLLQKRGLQSNQAESHAELARKTSPHKPFNGSSTELGKQDLDTISCEMLKSQTNESYELGEDFEEVKKELIQEDKKNKKAEMIGMEVKDEQISWTPSCITVGLTDSTKSSSEVLCYLTAPAQVTKVLRCKAVDDLSSLMVSGSEELISSVLRLENISNMKCPFPITVAVPFWACYCLNYHEAVVKVVDQEQRISYVTPAATEGIYGGRRVQPVDAVLLSSLKCRNDSCHFILSTSPLLYLNHPLTVSPLRPLTLTLPCPPKPTKLRRGEEKPSTYFDSTALIPDTISPHRVSASVKASRQMLTKDQLVVLGWKDEHWNVLDKVTLKTLQNDLVSFEMLENYERLIVLRLLSPVRPSCLVLFAEELQESVRTCTVSIVIHRKQEDPSSVVLAVLPSKNLSWGLTELHAQGYYGSPEQSSKILMREGEQLLVKFSGNISNTGQCTLTFHNQRRNWLFLQLKELNPFGNYSSTHYKGTAVLFQIPKDQLVWKENKAVVSEDYILGQAVCKLTLTLPKAVKTLSRPMSASFLGHDQAVWLCSKLSEKDASLLVMCLRLRRSSVQLAQLRAPKCLALQIFHILTTWRQALPALTPKYPLLAHCLTRIGRPELAAELLRKDMAKIERSGAETQRPVTVHDFPLQ
ncbi:Death domain-containing protein 1 [Bagarius yarrelli]|uniref:Death domain-containing protein 1 n=1 Tax=Bagarius yarrelli TaxID=175774 RepID=A0A556TZ55_BAGYA|nr:Death domain-containing protein 1 [Bagarius yarrelli]